MNKMKKLLSVLLAVLMILSSMTVMASAAKVEYQDVSELTTLEAYSGYGQVTRLNTEERMSIVFDFLDNVLAAANIAPMTIDITIATINVTLDSVNGICDTIDSVQSALSSGFSGFLVSIVGGLLGVIGDIDFDSWSSGMEREDTANVTIVYELVELLYTNKTLIGDIIRDREVDLGSIISGMVDISAVNDMIADLPGMVKGMIFPMFERKDDTISEVQTLYNNSKGDGNVVTTVTNFVKGLFNKPMSTTTVKFDADGTTITSAHTGFNNAFSDTYRYKYVMDTNASPYTITSWIYTYDDLAGTWGYVEEKVFTLTKEYPDLADSDYVYTAEDGTNLKWYEDESYWLAEQVDVDISAMSATELLYTLAPIVFEKMAPVVLNGSLKKLLGSWFGAKYNYVGEVGEDAVESLADSSDTFFTQEQGDYLWEWSDYAVINGTHYYRFEDQIFVADLDNTNPYFDVINWDYEITGDWLDDYIPASDDGETAAAGGYTTILQHLNKFLVKTANEVLADDIKAQFTLTDGDNTNLVANIKAVAQTIIKHDPASIFGSNYETDSYYAALTDSNNQTVLAGIAATVVDLLMPQMILPDGQSIVDQGITVGAILAAVVRELVSQLNTTNNYDALIYSDYNTKTFVAGKDNSYWLDVIMTMATDVGIHYLHNVSDMGEDDADAVTALGWSYNVTYTEAMLTTTDDSGNSMMLWEKYVDYIIDWALTADVEWAWHFENMVDVSAFTVDLYTVQDPWAKLDAILDSLLPLDEIFNETNLETAVRDKFILALVNLEWEKIVGGSSATGLMNIPTDSVLRTQDTLTMITQVIRDLINGLFNKLGNADLFDTTVFANLDNLATQNNIATLVETLFSMLYYTVGLTNGKTTGTGILDVVLPVVNMFLGWNTDAQQLADPQVISSTGLTGHKYSTNDVTIKFVNNSKGMLETHRTSEIEDSHYYIVIDSVSVDNSNYTLSGLTAGAKIEPYSAGTLTISGTPSGNEVICVEIRYHYTFKDGSQLGSSTSVAREYIYCTNEATDMNTTHSGPSFQVQKTLRNDLMDITAADTNDYWVLSSVSAVNTLSQTFTEDFSYAAWVKSATASIPSAYQNFIQLNDEFIIGCDNPGYDADNDPQGFIVGDSDDTNDVIWPYKYVSHADAENYLSGSVIDLGTYDITWHNHKKYTTLSVGDGGDTSVTGTIDPGDLYIRNTSVIESVYNDVLGANLQEEDYDATKWATLEGLMKEAKALIAKPNMLSSFTTDFDQESLDALAEEMQAAYDDLLDDASASAAATADRIAALDAALAGTEGDYEINYQDYVLYEYFNYEDVRTEVRNVRASLTAPEYMDTYYIEGSGIREAELDDVIAAEDNSCIAAGITASRSENTPEAIAAQKAYVDSWAAPSYLQLYLDDLIQKLPYYKQFLQLYTTYYGNDCKAFLDKELAYAEYNYPDSAESLYTAASWTEYQTRKANAEEISAESGALPSAIYTAKYHLMVAMKNLMLKTESLIEQGGTKALDANIVLADEIFTGLTDGTWAVKEGVDADTAYAELVKALGYLYTGEDGIEYNLYADSAIEYSTYDRPNTTNNQKKVDAANAALEVAIANFEQTASPELLLSAYGEEMGAVISTTYGTMDGYDGAVYGIDTLGVHTMDTLTDCLTTPAGYIVINTDNSGGIETTGTVIELYDDDDTLVASYIFIYFGDVDMDGMVTSLDATVIMDYELTLDGIYEEYVMMAADVDGDTMATSLDGTIIMDYELTLDAVGSYYPTQAEISANYQ